MHTGVAQKKRKREKGKKRKREKGKKKRRYGHMTHRNIFKKVIKFYHLLHFD
jgi:hypothetical protein